LHALSGVLAAAAGGMAVAVAVRSARVWGKRQAALERAARRIDAATVARLLVRLARLDALVKGIGHGSVWDELANIALALAGQPLPLEPLVS
jgi:DNA polymerase III delta subunit